jgi:UDP-N-acetylmuramoyl-tripeptide--D-alanyl-D-alanine ligase
MSSGRMQRRLLDAARAVGGQLLGGDVAFDAVSSDTRSLSRGSLFVALRGPNFDAHDFVAAAAAAGAVGAIVDHEVSLPGQPAQSAESASSPPFAQIVVPDTLLALQRLGAAWRKTFSLPVVAVAGSNGKTSTKEMTASILAQRGPVLATRGNLNNHIGVPLTLLRLEAQHRAAVIELGANRIGDVAELLPWVQPSVGLITNAGAEHLEFFGDLDGVARGEGETVAGLDTDATGVINADDAYADYWRGVSTAGRLLSFGVGAPADFRATHGWQGIENGEFLTRFNLHCPLGETQIVMRVGGSHNVLNALGAAAAASAAGASLADIAAGLAQFRPVSGRLQLKAGRQGSWIIDDSYNANPNSVRAGLDVLHAVSGPKWLVFGEMGELGAHADASHKDIGTYARACGIERLFAIGAAARLTVASFGAGAEWFPDADSLLQKLEAALVPGVTLLVKGSRVNRLERVVAALVNPVSAKVS